MGPERCKIVKYVINTNGAAIDYSAAVAMMDDTIRERLAADLAPCTEQDFFRAYELAHAAAYGEPWELGKANPIY